MRLNRNGFLLPANFSISYFPQKNACGGIISEQLYRIPLNQVSKP